MSLQGFAKLPTENVDFIGWLTQKTHFFGIELSNLGDTHRYYIPQRDTKEGAGSSGLARMPAAELEAAVLSQLQNIIRAPNLAVEIAERAKTYDSDIDEAKVTVALRQFEQVWAQIFPAEQSRIVQLLVERITVSNTGMDIRLHANGLVHLVAELSP